MIYGFSDSNFIAGEKPTGGQLTLIGNKYSDKVSPILWKTKLIQKACKSPKDAETIALGVEADLAIYTANQVEQILTGKNGGSKYKVRLFCDNAPVIESIASSKQVERRYMRSDINILKQFIEEQKIEYISWIQDEEMIADILTKDKPDKIGLSDLMQQGQLKVVRRQDNIVYHNGRDYKIEGRALREKLIKSKIIPSKRKTVKQAQEQLAEQVKKENEME